jgi:ribosomal-protein-alanine N-acetyltransferase
MLPKTSMTTPIIETNRLRLSPFTRDDGAAVFDYASNPNVSRFTTWLTHQTIADSEAFIEMVLRRPAHEHTWAIRLRDDRRAVGAIEFGLKNDCDADFHYVLAEPLWNQGLMTEAARAVVAWGLEHYPAVRRVFTMAISENVAPQRVMEKCGLQFERVHLDRWAKFPEPVELQEYALIRETLKENHNDT